MNELMGKNIRLSFIKTFKGLFFDAFYTLNHRLMTSRFLTIRDAGAYTLYLVAKLPFIIKNKFFHFCLCCGEATRLSTYKQFVHVFCDGKTREPCEFFDTETRECLVPCKNPKMNSEKVANRRVAEIIEIAEKIYRAIQRFNHCVCTDSTDVIHAIELLSIRSRFNAFYLPFKIDAFTMEKEKDHKKSIIVLKFGKQKRFDPIFKFMFETYADENGKIDIDSKIEIGRDHFGGKELIEELKHRFKEGDDAWIKSFKEKHARDPRSIYLLPT